MTTPTPSSAAPWTDRKYLLWLASPFLPLLGFLSLLAGFLLKQPAIYWLMPVFFYAVLPLMDWLVGTDINNPPESAVAQLEANRYYRAIVYAYIPAQYATTIMAVWLATSGDISAASIVALVITAGLINGVAINTAHELGHKRADLEKWLAKITLAPVAYGHFFVEHNRGHHKNVATPRDPASSRMGETFYAFLPRTMIGSLRSAWELEGERLARQGKSVWSLENENLRAWSLTVLLFGALTLWLGTGALAFLAIQAFFGAALLEVVNYLEHYGLLRQWDERTQRYERCAPSHSWNSNNVVTNLLLYQLQRHSDHHANPTRRFQSLRHFDESPQLPSGYASMLILAYIPPLWFKVMNPRVARHYGGDVTKAHLYGPKREQLIRKWQTATTSCPETVVPATPSQEEQHTPNAASASRHRCSNCGYVYDELKGNPSEGFVAGTPWKAIPADWSCPECAVRDKADFVPLTSIAN